MVKKKAKKTKARKKAKPAKKRAVKKAKRPPAKKKGKKKKFKKPAAPAKPKIEGKLIGVVTHYFPHVEAAVVKIKAGELRVNDTLRFIGHTSDFKQVVASIQIDRKPVEKAKKGAEVGVGVKERVREGDKVYKL